MAESPTSREALQPKPPVIVAFGNAMACDDGVGPWIVSRLERLLPPQAARLEIAAAPGPELFAFLEAPGELWLIDAARGAGLAPGCLLQRRIGPGEEPPLMGSARLVSTHGLSVVELLKLADALHRRRATVELFGVVGERFEAGDRLSPAVERAAERLIVDLVARLGPSAAVGPDAAEDLRRGNVS